MLPPASGVTYTSPIRYTVRAGVVHWEGLVDAPAGGWPVGTITVGTIPSPLRPGVQKALPVVAGPPLVGGLVARVSGALDLIVTVAGAVPVTIGGSYPLD